MVVDLARVHGAALAHELEQELRPLLACRRPGSATFSGNAGVRARMHQCLDGPGDEAVGDEEVLFDVDHRIAAFEVAGTVVLDAMAQREVLRARRRPDWIGLHEAQPVEGALERRGREEAPGDGETPQIGERDHSRRAPTTEDAEDAEGWWKII